jgi:hypothetical protein
VIVHAAGRDNQRTHLIIAVICDVICIPAAATAAAAAAVHHA